ncbi:MAG TPA: ABC transporter permease [Chitinophagaceae bacterium]|nr:ABC transporter permease [Chitinophagaceae bacterium]
MNAFTLHITLYDLFFFGMIFVGLAFALLLAFVKTANRSANRFLALALVIMVLWMVRILAIDIRLESYLPRWNWMPMEFLLALGPLMYFYVLKITRPQYTFRWKDMLHFAPLLLEQAALTCEIGEGAKTGKATYLTHSFRQINPVLQLLVFISIISYLYRSYKLILHFYSRQPIVIMDRSRLEFRWLRRLLAATAVLWCLWLAFAVIHYIGYRNQPGIQLYYPFYIFFVVMMIWTAAAAFLKPQAAVKAQTPATVKPPVPAELRAKGAWLKRAMEAKKFYENPELTLSSLAEKLNLHPHELSRVINTALKKNFNDFINEYRVREVIVKMQDPAYDNITLLGIAYEAGFNSQTSFNRIFKQLAGKSPLEYKNGLKKEQPTYHLGNRAIFTAVISNHQTTHKWNDVKLNRNYMFRNYFKIAWRNLLRNKIYSLINIAGLSIGLACAMLIMLYVQDEVSYDRFHKNASQVYRIDRQITRNDKSVTASSYTGLFPGPRFSTKIPEIQNFTRFQQAQADIKTGANIQSQSICYVDSNFFSVFSFPLISGDAGSVLVQPNSVVLSEEMAKKYFGGNTSAMGKTMSINTDGVFRPYIVTGIAKNNPQNSSIKFHVLLPLKVSAADESNNNNWFNSFLSTFVVLSPGADANAVQNKMDRVFETDASKAIGEIESKYGITDIGISYLLEPLTAIHLGQVVPAEDEILSDRSNPEFSYILSAIAIFVLLIACINFVNLTVARSVKRAKEIGIRKVMGGTSQQLRVQFLSESFILCLIAFFAALVIAAAVLPVFSQLSNKVLLLSYLFNAKLVMYYLALFVITSLLAGFYPSVVLSNYNPVKTLYSRFNLAGKNYLQKALVIFQFALASFLIIGSITIFLQFNYLTTQSLGYDDNNLITVDKYPLSRNEAALLKQELMKNPNITDVAPRNGGFNNNTVKAGSDRQVNTTIETVDASYLPLLKVPVIAGRNFSPEHPSDSTHSVLVNEAFVQQAGWKQPVGEQIKTFENETYTVIGVVKNYHYKPLTEKIGPQFYTINPANSYGMVYIKIKPGTETASLQYIAKTFKSLFPLSPFSYTFKQEQNEQSYAAEARWKQIILLSAVLTIFISCIGLFGLSVLSAEKRVKEIGVRKVLGASVSRIVAILSADFLKLIFISLAISIPLAWVAANKWLQNYPYRIGLSGWLLASGGVLVILVALVTISFQSIKAALTNPVKSLRTE